MFPRIGEVVLYKLTNDDAIQITRRRTTPEAVRNRLRRNPPEWPEGAQAHLGDPVLAGELVPMLVTRINEGAGLVGGQVFLNGSDTHWIAAVQVADQEPTDGQAITMADRASDEVSEGAGRKARR